MVDTEQRVGLYRNYVGGEWKDPQSVVDVDDPSTGERLATVADSTAAEATVAVDAARKVFDSGTWSGMSVDERAAVLLAVATELEKQYEAMEEDLVRDTGCPVRLCSMMQVGSALAHLRDYAEMGFALSTRAYPITDTPGFGQFEVRREPVGVVAAFSPFNVPLTVAVWKVAPALLAGNSVVLKPSPLTPAGIDYLARAFAEVDVPAGVFNVVHGDREAGSALVGDPRVDMVTFTGSTAVGQEIGRIAASSSKETLLELGGKSPAIMLEDADAELTVRGTLFGSMLLAGQACAATTRMFVPASRYSEVLELLAARAQSLRVGPAHDLSTDIGPVISARQRDRVLALIRQAIDQGATALTGGAAARGDANGYYVAPTVLIDVDNESTIAQTEVFGPVLCVTKYETPDEAVHLANRSSFGLAGAVWSSDLQVAREIAGKLETGTVWINDFGLADVRYTPFGGRKHSGVGAEFGVDGVLAYSKPKSVYTALDTDLDVRAYSMLGLDWP